MRSSVGDAGRAFNNGSTGGVRRMVIFAGPHKSASSSVQELFIKFASNDPSRKAEWNHPSLRDWLWPWNPRRHSYQPRKGFAPLVTEGIGYHELIWENMMQVWNATDPQTGNHLYPHVIWGSEELDRFGSTPWSGRNGMQAMQQVYSMTKPGKLDIVVNYRRPRKAQWISIWKQLMRKVVQGRAYGGFLCDPEEYKRIWEYLDCVANPLGLVQALLDFWDQQLRNVASIGFVARPSISVHLLDMQGIAEVNRDVGHVLACDVMKVKCTADHWLPNVERPILRNVKSGNPELTDAEMDEMEWILLQRDCSYRSRLLKAMNLDPTAEQTRLYLHYADTVWHACSNQDDSLRFSNTTFLLDLLQSQVGCGSLKKGAISELQELRSHHLHSNDFNIPNVKSAKNSSTGILSHPLEPKRGFMTQEHHTDMMEAATYQLLALYMLLVFVIGNLIRQFKCRKFVAQRRLAGRHHMSIRGSS